MYTRHRQTDNECYDTSITTNITFLLLPRSRSTLLYIEEGAVCVLSYEWLNRGLALGLLIF